MKITKKLREQAAMICAIGASNDAAVPWTLDFQIVEHQLANAAWRHVFDAYPSQCGFEVLEAEAEALLRTGFVPEGWS